MTKRPITRRELVIDNYHGTPVADPYRWLEDDTAPEVQQWMDEQNNAFQDYIGEHSIRDELKTRLSELIKYPRCTVPRYESGVYYAWRNDGLQNQSVLYGSSKLDEIGEVVFDPNKLSDDGTVAVSSYSFSPDGKYLAYSLSASGSDWKVGKVLDLATKQDLTDTLKFMRYSGFSWLPDSSGFFYTRYPEPDVDTVLKADSRNAMAYMHLLGQEQSQDTLIHKDPANPDWGFYLHTDEDKKWLFMSVSYSTLFKNKLFYKPLANLESPWLPIADTFDEGYDLIGVADDKAYLFTQENAPFGKVVSIKLSEKGATDWQTVIPDQGEMLEYTVMVNNHLMCAFLHHATHQLKLYDLTGKYVRDIELPAMASIVGLSCKQRREEFFIQICGYLYPDTVLRYDFSGNAPSTWFAPKIDFPFGEYETVQEFATSKDGTQVPLFITRRKGLALDGSHPTLLYGYGGFNISITPTFSPQRLAWLEKGGVYVDACLRGGAEYGEAWHRAGMLESKQNVFDDFIAAGEHLIARKITSSGKLAIRGGSNGGLLTGACVTQRPDLFGAVIVAVPVLDMLRYHRFTAGRFWVGEYGCSDNSEEFAFIYKYSPLHNVKMNTVYPATLVMTADTDDRVVPSQARKFMATLQAADGGDNPIFIRIEKSAGHGHGKPISKIIDEAADCYAFMLVNLCK
ncbi:MAG: prolyl oligopeptidase family serine peptidase [Defluviitaleaceae bacterium]|nr:prolyl oligopeptidase family serine peptidase [Defluviitaleaceae bacterium]